MKNSYILENPLSPDAEIAKDFYWNVVGRLKGDIPQGGAVNLKRYMEENRKTLQQCALYSFLEEDHRNAETILQILEATYHETSAYVSAQAGELTSIRLADYASEKLNGIWKMRQQNAKFFGYEVVKVDRKEMRKQLTDSSEPQALESVDRAGREITNGQGSLFDAKDLPSYSTAYHTPHPSARPPAGHDQPNRSPGSQQSQPKLL